MNFLEFIFVLVIGLLIGFLSGQLTNQSFDEGYQKGWIDYQAQVLPLVEQSKNIVNECVEKTYIVIDERDACETELAVCKNELNHCKGVN